MTTKRARRGGRSSKGAKSLPAKALKADQARRVKGGNIEVNYQTTPDKVFRGVGAVQKVRE